MFTVYGKDYSMPTYPHTFAEPIKDCWVELIEPTNDDKFNFIVKDCDHPTIQHRFSCFPWHVPGEIERAVSLVVEERNIEQQRLKDAFHEHMKELQDYTINITPRNDAYHA
jgi:hypothetical protein